MRFKTIVSGSSGNCIYIGENNTNILIDAGASLKTVVNGLEDYKDISGILVTHEHIDHIKGLEVISRNLKCKIYANLETANEIMSKSCKFSESLFVIIEEKQFIIGDFCITPFLTPHDSVKSYGFTITGNGGAKAVVATDLGYITDEIENIIIDSDILAIESNYDEYMLKNGMYPQFLKRRIISKNGHLSNDDCAEVVYKAICKKTKHVFLSHLSNNNNEPRIALNCTLNYLKQNGIEKTGDITIVTAPRFDCSKLINV